MSVFDDNIIISSTSVNDTANSVISSANILNGVASSSNYFINYGNDACTIDVNPLLYSFTDRIAFSHLSESVCCEKSSEKEEKKNMKPAPKEIKIEIPDKDGNITVKTIIVPVPYQPRRIFFDPPATVVFWEDDTKTVVRCTEDDEFNPYYGFVCALGKKMFGTNNEIARMIKNAEWKYDKSSKNKEKKVETKPAPKKAQPNKNSKKEKPKK